MLGTDISDIERAGANDLTSGLVDPQVSFTFQTHPA